MSTADLAPRENPAGRGERVHVERGAKRIRVYLGGEVVADTTRPLLVWERPYYPTYYFPLEDVRGELLEPAGDGRHSPSRGEGTVLAVRAGGKRAIGAALRYGSSPVQELRDAIRFEWDAMDAWFEEDEEVYTHARDPHTRVEVLASSRHVRVEVEGTTIAESQSPRLLFETGLPVRFYVPKPHVRMDLLERSDTVTHCPYKGRAETWSVRLGGRLLEDLAWSYPTPLPESEKIAGLVAFYNDKVELFVDGVRQ
ncbi:MAG TPA: DUF427 domain-containing protein [Solirubrobacteraceae bacterium]|jgi:uncharacterized protein (DUF427 family)